MNQTQLFILAICMVPACVIGGVGVKVCQLWLAQHGEQEQPLGIVWQIAVFCTVLRIAALLAELYAVVRMLMG